MLLREPGSVSGDSADGEQHEQAEEILWITLAFISGTHVDLVVYFENILADKKSVVDVESGKASSPGWSDDLFDNSRVCVITY
jgi:hypothetical protein